MDFDPKAFIRGPVKLLNLRSVTLSDRQFGRAVTVLVALGFAALVAAGGMAAWTVMQGQTYTQLTNHTYQVDAELSEFRLQVERAESARRGYMLTGDGRYETIINDVLSRIDPTLHRVAGLTADNPRQVARMARLRRLVANQKIFLLATRDMVASGRNAQAVRVFATDESGRTISLIRAVSMEMVEEEQRLLAVRTDQQTDAIRRFYIILALAGFLLLLVGAASLWIILRYTRALTASQRELRSLNDDLEGAVGERTQDLQRANDEIQRFAYIVSHDLRSPLVNVMGFTSEMEAATDVISDLITRADEAGVDIVTAEARAAATEDLPEAIGFIRTSTQKMDRLINAILKLSRQGRRVLAPERLDMTQVVGTIEDSLRQKIDGAGVTFLVEGDLPNIYTDRTAIEQILSNLVENALKYLSAARPGRVVVRGWTEDNRAIFEVEDNGRGIDPRDHDRIFDLFRRSGTQDQPGEGIGLAHVRALAYRLGGVVDCRSELDRGATFRLSIPIRYSAEQGALS